MDKSELDKILDLHLRWLKNEQDGSRANLSRANLSGANLSGAYLSGADLKETILDGLNWLTYIGITANGQGIAYAYKLINEKGEGPFNGGINYLEGETFEVAEVDPDITKDCSYGINLATFQWCLNEKQEGRRILLMQFNISDAICPIGNNDKFRVKKCTKVGEVDWHGNLLR